MPIEPSSESAPDLAATPAARRRFCCLDPQGWIQALGGLVIGLIALLSSYDHLSLPAGAIPHPQQWGIWFIAATLRPSPKALLRCNGFWSLRVSLRPVAHDISRRLYIRSVSAQQKRGELTVQSVLKRTIMYIMDREGLCCSGP